MEHLVILAHGDFPSSEKTRSLLRSAECIVCCDAAAALLSDFGIEADAIVGDMDSLPAELQELWSDRIVRFSGQDDNDLTKAFHYAIERYNPRKITILGATGAREDHTLANVSLLLDYAREAAPAKVEMLTDFGRFEAIFDSAVLKSETGQEISIFAFDSTLKIKSAGLVYPTDNVVFDTLWKATLNVARGEEFSLELSHPCGVLLFFADRR